MTTRVSIALSIVLATMTACTSQPNSAAKIDEWVGTITTEGNVTTVVNQSGSVWGGEARLVEEMSIGVDVGEDEYMLGRIANLFVADGLVYLTDTQVPAVRVYSTDGRYVRTIGRGPGQGPGEYTAPVLVSAVVDGTVFVYDPNNRRLTAFDSTGETSESWDVQDAACCAWRMSVAPDGTLWLPVEQHGFASPTGDTRHGARAYTVGAEPRDEIRWHPDIDFPIDVIDVGGMEMTVPFSPEYAWALSADGGVIVGASDRYRFEVHRMDGGKLVVEREVDLVPVDPDEAEWRRGWTLHNIRSYIEPTFDASMVIPEHKPAFVGFAPDAHGGAWVWRRGPSRHVGGDCVEDPFDTDVATARDKSCWTADGFFDVFDGDGRYLGWVRQPDGLARWNAQLNLFPMGDIVYAIIETAEGVPTVKRYGLALPGEEATQR